MTADRRFPYMHRIDDDSMLRMFPIPGLGVADGRAIARFALRVAKSTQTYAWWHSIWRRPCWCLRADRGTPLIAEALVFHPSTGAVIIPNHDDVRRSIYAGRPTARQKDWAIYCAEKNAQKNRDIAMQKHFDNLRPAALDRARSITSGRVSVLAR